MTRAEAAVVLRGLAEVAERRRAEQPTLAAFIAIEELSKPRYDPDAVAGLLGLLEFGDWIPDVAREAAKRVRESRQP